MNKNKNKNIVFAMLNALNGLRELFLERAVAREIILIAIIGILFLWRQNTHTLLLLALGFVLISIECINTAIEMLCDYISPSYHPSIGKVKDLGAAAVLIIIFGMSIIFISFLFNIF